MITPLRLQLSRRRGFNLQAHSRAINGLQAMNCARPHILGNPFIVGINGDAEICVALFRRWVETWNRGDELFAWHRRAMALARGKNLACFCKLTDKWCHVDVLLEIANK